MLETKFNAKINKLFPDETIQNISLLKGGSNNRIIKLNFSFQSPIILKEYFINPNDNRNRLDTEYNFLTLLNLNNIKNIPKPIFKFSSDNFALYSFVEGKIIESKDLSENIIFQAMNFLKQINIIKSKALNIKKASDSCFSIEDYLFSINYRMKNLLNLPIKTNIDKDASLFIKNNLLDKWKKLKSMLLRREKDFHIIKEDYILSPSDFGFHNCLININKKLNFIDFEYAGFDDPAKTICDFITQPNYRIDHKYLEKFKCEISSLLKDPLSFNTRSDIIFPISQFKWCCIMLNVFIKKHFERRKFSNSTQKKELQLNKASQALKNIHI